MTNNALAKVPDDDAEWNAIVNQLVDELQGDDLPDNVVRATEMMISGYPVHKIAKKLNTTTATIRRWLSAYPTMAAAVANSQKLLSKWRMSKLEQQFLAAVERSQEILDVGLDGLDADGYKVDPKTLTVIAAQARYVIGLFAGQQMNVRVTHELGDTVMKAKQDALSYLAEQLAAQRIGDDTEPIEAVFRVVDSKIDNEGPMLDEEGNPPHGVLGKLDSNDDGTQCHICGTRYKNLAKHLLTKHNITTIEYEQFYLLGEGDVRAADGYWSNQET